MHIFLPTTDELSNDFRTSFTFENVDEQNSFITWLDYMKISHVKAKIPCIVDGKMTQQTCVVIDNTQLHNKVSSESVSPSSQSPSSSVVNVDSHVKEDNEEEHAEEDLNDNQQDDTQEEVTKPEKKKKKKSKHVEVDE